MNRLLAHYGFGKRRFSKATKPSGSCRRSAALASASTWRRGNSSSENCPVTPSHFVAQLAEMRLPSVFNPYADCCSVHDRADAVRLRKRNLQAFLEAALTSKVDTIWVA